MTRALALALALSVLSLAARAQNLQAEPAVKKSRQGICHERGTVSYVQTIYFEPFASIDECLRSGGRLANAPSPGAPEYHSIKWWWNYFRPYFGQILAASVLIGLALAWLRPWFLKRRSRGKLRQFEREAQRRWEGHRRH